MTFQHQSFYVRCNRSKYKHRSKYNYAKTYYIFYYSKLFCELVRVSKLLSRLEAAIGIEPMNKGFAVLISESNPV